MTNAGVRDVSVIMQRSYHSLLDHLGSGKDWDLSRLSGGLTLLPPFGLFDSQFGEYRGCMPKEMARYTRFLGSFCHLSLMAFISSCM